ncbi:nibrin [Trichonephila clavipes]|nr:nibrin [Trichonephila clavipes]
MFSDKSRFSLQSDSRRTLIWREPGTRYHQENTIERHRYGGAGWLALGEELFLVPELTCMFRVRMPSIGGYHPYGLVSIFTELESIRACDGYAWLTNCSPLTSSHMSTGTSEGIA